MGLVYRGLEMTSSNTTQTAAKSVYAVIDRHTNTVVSKHSTRIAASRKVDRLDNAYGAYRHTVRRLTLLADGFGTFYA